MIRYLLPEIPDFPESIFLDHGSLSHERQPDDIILGNLELILALLMITKHN